MKCSIEEAHNMLDSYYRNTEPDTKFGDILEDLIEIVIHQLAMPRIKAIAFIHNWFDNRH